MSWTVSPDFSDALATSYEPVAEADLYVAGVLKRTNLPLTGGAIAIREDSKVRRTLHLPIGFVDLTTTETYDLLTPFGGEIAVRAGLRLGVGYTEMVPVGRFVIEDAGQDSHYGDPTVTAGDRSVLIQADRFLTPHNTNGERTVSGEIKYLLQQSIPGLEVFDLTTSQARTPVATWDRERWDCCEALAASIGAEVYFDPEGRAIIRPVPEANTVLDPSWTVKGEEGGVLSDYSTGLSRDQVYNAVVVTGDTSDPGVPPVTAIVYQQSGPLRWAGPFGRVPRFYSTPVVRTYDGAVSAGRKVLARSVAYSRRLLVDVVPNAALDTGDQLDVKLPDGSLERRVLREAILPLGLDKTMRVGTRVGIDAADTADAGKMP